MKLAVTLALAATAMAAALPAAAQFQKPEDAVKYRQSVMTVQSFHLGRIGAMANGRVPFDPGGHPNSPTDGHPKLPHLS